MLFSKLYACIFNINKDCFALQLLSYQIALSCLGLDISLNHGTGFVSVFLRLPAAELIWFVKIKSTDDWHDKGHRRAHEETVRLK